MPEICPVTDERLTPRVWRLAIGDWQLEFACPKQSSAGPFVASKNFVAAVA